MTKENINEEIRSNLLKNSIFSFFLIIVFGIIDWKTGYKLSFQFFYFIPLGILAYNVKQKNINLILWSFLVSLVWGSADYFAREESYEFQIQLWNVISRFIVFIFFSIFLNTIVKTRTKLNTTNAELTKKSKQISDSIEYAKSIQNAVIPDYKKFSSIFPQSYLLFKPKDVLSGDFFWSHQQDDIVIFALVDCTGHGIPGALLSVIGVIFLNKVVVEKEIHTPSVILKELNAELISLLSSGNETVDDGMEISVISYDLKTREMTIAQTSKSVMVIDQNGKKTTFQSSLFTIGGILSRFKTPSYTNHHYKIAKGDMLYLYSDGYPDQFGYQLNMKLGTQIFEVLLENIKDLETNDQLIYLENEHLKWKGDFKQTDDITIVGVKF